MSDPEYVVRESFGMNVTPTERLSPGVTVPEFKETVKSSETYIVSITRSMTPLF